MTENVIFLLIGSGIGLVISLITTWFQHRLERKRELERWIREREQTMIEEAHRLMGSKGYPLLRYGPSGTIELCKFGVESGPDRGTTFQVKKNVVVIGRSGELCDHVLSDPEIADVHLRLIVADRAYVLEDVSGGLGVWVNRALMVGPIVLRDNDQIQIGSTLLRFSEMKVGEHNAQ